MNNRNRGKNTGDDIIFGSEKQKDKLKSAVQDMQYLLSRDYAEKASSELVGNRYRLKPDRFSRSVELLLQRFRFKIENLNSWKFRSWKIPPFIWMVLMF